MGDDNREEFAILHLFTDREPQNLQEKQLDYEAGIEWITIGTLNLVKKCDEASGNEKVLKNQVVALTCFEKTMMFKTLESEG